MDITKFKKLYYRLKHQYLTMNNIVVGVALLLAASWAWGSIGLMQRNYGLQRDVDAQRRQAEVLELEVANMRYQQNYYNSDEYKDLAARQHLGLASEGEKVLMLPPNTEAAKRDDAPAVQQALSAPPTNLEQWIDFLLGGNAANSEDLQN
jgi:cell division protein FtsB